MNECKSSAELATSDSSGRRMAASTHQWPNPPVNTGPVCLSLCLEHLSLSTPACQFQSPTAGSNPAVGSTPSSVPAQVMAGHGPHSNFSIRVTCTEPLLYLIYFSNYPCKTLTLPSFMTILGGRANNCSHFIDGEA